MNNLSRRPQNKSFGSRAKDANIKKREVREREYYLNPNKCKHCDAVLPYRSNKQFCNRSCAASFNNIKRGPKTEAQKRKTSNTLKRISTEPKWSKIQFSRCSICHSPFYVRHHKNIRTNICSSCKDATYTKVYANTCECCGTVTVNRTYRKYCNACTPNLEIYRHRAAFTFNVYEYPAEFDISLVESLGWYSPNGRGRKNKQPNLAGVSRDHLYSIKDGFDNDVDPKLLAHPANCQLLVHNGPRGNNQKNSHSEITLDQLLDRIAVWDATYTE